MSFQWETLLEVVALLKTKEARDNGVEERVFRGSAPHGGSSSVGAGQGRRAHRQGATGGGAK